MHLNSRFWWGVALIAIGVLFLLDARDIVEMNVLMRNYWPLLLVLWGLLLLFGRTGKKEKTGRASAPLSDIGFGGRLEDTDSGELKMSNVFGEMRIRVTSRMFRGGAVSTVFGEVEIDLARAMPAEGDHMLKLDTVFGAVRVILPQGVEAAVAADAVLGEVAVHEVKKSGFFPSVDWVSASYNGAPAKLRIEASTVMGSVTVIRAGG